MEAFTPVVERLSSEIKLDLKLQIMEIEHVVTHENGKMSIRPVKESDVELTTTLEFVARNKTVGGDFYVVYPNGMEGTIPRTVMLSIFPDLIVTSGE